MQAAACVGAVDPGEHDPGGAEVEQSPGADPVGGLDPDDGRHAVRRGGGDDVPRLLLAAGAVLEVEQDPVDAGRRADLGGDRRRGAEEGAVGDLGRGEPASQRTAVEDVPVGRTRQSSVPPLRGQAGLVLGTGGADGVGLGDLGRRDVPPATRRRQVGVRDDGDDDDDRTGLRRGSPRARPDLLGGRGAQGTGAEPGGDLDEVELEVVAGQAGVLARLGSRASGSGR